MMHRLLLAVALVVVVPNLGFAAPCLNGSLATYIGLGSTGCQVGTATFFDFSSGPSFFGGTEISSSAISVLPLLTSPGFDFLIVPPNAGPGEVRGVAIGYSVSGLTFQALLAMTGAAATGDGVVTVVEDLCLGGTFGANPATCAGGTPVSLVTAQDSLGPTGPDTRNFPVSSFFDVFTDITIDGGLRGTANVNLVRNQFAVPEPSTVLLLGSGLVVLFMARAHRRWTERV